MADVSMQVYHWLTEITFYSASILGDTYDRQNYEHVFLYILHPVHTFIVLYLVVLSWVYFDTINLNPLLWSAFMWHPS